MTPVEVTLSEAVSVLRDATIYPNAVRRAMIDVLNAGLCWFDDERAWGIWPADRVFKTSTQGRATIALAEAVIKAAS